MQVFKFGGASIKDVKAVKNIAAILATYKEEKLVVVVSAMGKTTNKLESILHDYLSGKDYKLALNTLGAAHKDIIEELFEQPAAVINEFNNLIHQLENTLIEHKNEPYNFLYDAIISMGERMSSLIIARYLN
jgi:aspartate kinase